MTPAELSVMFFLQLAVIIGVSRVVGWLAKRFLGQPQVVGEMIAGVLLGPSLFGALAPEIQGALFPQESRGLLYVVAQLGVGLYMFMVGLGFSAWIVLAVVLATLGAGAGVAITAIVGGVGFVLFMTLVAPRLLAPLGRIVEREGRINQTVLGITLGLFMLAAFAMDYAGLHAVFGGFILGAVMPRGFFAEELRRRIEPFVVTALLPVFFCYSGLNTQLTMVNNANLALITVAILAASIFAKGGACWAAARFTGQDHSTALGIGALMNARGLMELIIINIGLQRGVIETPLFSMLVLMAVVTTLMASPLFEWVYGRKARERGELGALADVEEVPGEGTRAARQGDT